MAPLFFSHHDSPSNLPGTLASAARWLAAGGLLVGWRRYVRDMHGPNSLIDARSASPRAPRLPLSEAFCATLLQHCLTITQAKRHY